MCSALKRLREQSDKTNVPLKAYSSDDSVSRLSCVTCDFPLNSREQRLHNLHFLQLINNKEQECQLEKILFVAMCCNGCVLIYRLPQNVDYNTLSRFERSVKLVDLSTF